MYLTSNSLPFFPVWSDVRTKSIVDTYASKIKNTTFLTTICGLPISTYFSAVKLNWLMDNVDEVKNAIKDNKCLFGTVDSWLIWVRVLLEIVKLHTYLYLTTYMICITEITY